MLCKYCGQAVCPICNYCQNIVCDLVVCPRAPEGLEVTFEAVSEEKVVYDAVEFIRQRINTGYTN